jgi:hypothetical protein
VQGGHLNSLALLQAGAVDCAAIDCVVFQEALADMPTLADAIRVLPGCTADDVYPTQVCIVLSVQRNMFFRLLLKFFQ